MTRSSIQLAGAVFAAGRLAIAGAALAIALSSIPGAKPGFSTVVALTVPVFAAVAAVHGGMRLTHVLTWAIPSSFLLLLVFLSPPTPDRPCPIVARNGTSGFDAVVATSAGSLVPLRSEDPNTSP